MAQQSQPLNKWILIHTYTHLADEGKVLHLRCPDDAQLLISMIDTVDTDNEDPILWCPCCDSKVNPGIAFWDQIDAAVRENYDI